MNIYESISAVMSDIGAIGKKSKNAQQGFMFRGIDAVMNAISPALQKYKVFIVPEVLEQIREERTSLRGGSLLYSICKVKYTFYAEDGSNISATVIGEGMDSGDKATNKAMSIAFKYACFQVFCIPTEEMVDPDAECHEVISKGKAEKEVQTPEAKKEVQTPEAKQRIDRTTLKAVRARIANAAAQGKTLEEADLCKMFKIENLEDMTFEIVNKFNALMDKAGV